MGQIERPRTHDGVLRRVCPRGFDVYDLHAGDYSLKRKGCVSKQAPERSGIFRRTAFRSGGGRDVLWCKSDERYLSGLTGEPILAAAPVRRA